MKKAITLIAFTLTMATPLLAQSNKEKLVDAITDKHTWMTGYVVDKLFTINLSPTMWASIVDAPDNQPRGRESFKRMAQALVDFSDKMGYTSLNEKCGFTVDAVKSKEYRPTCKQQIDGLVGKLSFTCDAPTVAKNPDSYNLTLGYMTTIAEFFDSGSSSYVERGWRPKGNKLAIILSLSDKNTAMKVAWSTDGQTVTVSGPASKEVSEWDSTIQKGLAKGGK